MGPTFEIHDFTPAEAEEGVTLTDILAGIAIMYFIFGTTLFCAGLV